MLTQAFFERQNLPETDLDCDILSDSTAVESQFHDEIVWEEELEMFERSSPIETVLSDPVWRYGRLICRNFDNCSNIRCPYSHPKEISLDWNSKKCDKENRFHGDIAISSDFKSDDTRSSDPCPNIHRISNLPDPMIVCGVSSANSAFVRWKKSNTIIY